MAGAGSLLPHNSGQTLQEAAQRGHGVSILGGFEALTGQSLDKT